MSPSLYDIDLIERYFDNTLSEVETLQLESRLKTDSDLKQLFDQEKLLVNTIRYQATENNLKFLKDIEKALTTPGRNAFQRYWYYYAAASVVLLILAGIFWPAPQQTPDALYTAYFAPYPNVFEPTLRSTGAVSYRSEAFQAYEAGNYRKAAELFTLLLKEKKEPGMLLLLGNANLALNHTEEAIKNFNELLVDFDDLDVQAKWFLSLCYLRKGDIERTRNLLTELGKTEISYAQKAKELLKKVE